MIEHLRKSYGWLKKPVLAGTMTALLLSGDQDDLWRMDAQIEAAQAQREAIADRAVQVRQDIARQFGSCGVRGFLHVYSGFPYPNLSYVHIDHIAQETVQRRPAETVRRDHINVDLTIALTASSLEVWDAKTHPSISVAEGIPLANRVRRDERGRYHYAEPIPVDVSYVREGSVAVASVDVYPPSDGRFDAPIAIRMGTVTGFDISNDPRSGVYRSFGAVVCGVMTYEDGVWQLMSGQDTNSLGLRPAAFTHVDQFE